MLRMGIGFIDDINGLSILMQGLNPNDAHDTNFFSVRQGCGCIKLISIPIETRRGSGCPHCELQPHQDITTGRDVTHYGQVSFLFSCELADASFSSQQKQLVRVQRSHCS